MALISRAPSSLALAPQNSARPSLPPALKALGPFPWGDASRKLILKKGRSADKQRSSSRDCFFFSFLFFFVLGRLSDRRRNEMALRLDGKQRCSKSNSPSPRTPTTPTVEQLLYEGPGESSRWSSSSPTSMRGHDLEDDHFHPSPNSKKSVLAKVKERARRWRLGLGKRRNADDGDTTPSWGVSLDEDDTEDDAEYLGAPMYESELAPEDCKENARQHPRANPVMSEKHLLPNSINHETEPGKGSPLSPNKTMTETMTGKLAPAYAMVSDATQAITSKIQNAPAYATDATYAIASKIQNAPAYATDATHAVASKIQNLTVGSPAAGLAAGGPAKTAVRGHEWDTPAEQKWDKGVSVKEYIMQKFEPGEDDRALSQVISEAISPRKGPADAGVIEKVREAVSNLLRNQEASSTTAFHSATNSSAHITVSNNPHEAMEEGNYGRILQTN